ncbi:MAG: hypothetical protein PW845_04220 [Pseudomonas sp.]|uniref:hypothetical protein n=1 Tax=Pseudomonas abieticivorans TaxID=2931382 RepID=UPI0020BE3475|nr:hypothetical protein [Pseudomonas sp. PIA16]MDE1164590.1 hypothetical protein [Pseudomonas sp.]
MNNKRVVGWLVFFAVAAAVASYPDLFLKSDVAEQEATATAPVKARLRGSLPAAGAAKAEAPIKDLSPAGDLFAAKSWKPLATLATVTEQPVNPTTVVQAPSAPPMPFQFIGRLDDRRDLQVFLQNGEKIYVVRKGDVIDDTWRIETISDKELRLVYLPLHLAQTLSVGSTQ